MFKFIIKSNGIKRVRNIKIFLENSVIIQCRNKIVLGWGNKPNTQKPRAYAKKHGLPYWSLEDGFLRSIGLGVEGHAPLSLAVDDLGIYYDATRPSRLEALIDDTDALAPLLADGQKALDLIVQHLLSKYNHAPDALPNEWDFAQHQKNVLVIDQTAGDMALQYGGATPETFSKMFDAACEENPDAKIWVKIHPDVLSGKKQGHLLQVLNNDRVEVIAENINPMVLLDKMDVVYTVTSQMGFEALMLGKKVVTFGLPWYAAWGVCDDRHPEALSLQQTRRGQSDVLSLFTAAYLQYCRYINPNNQERGTVFDVIDYLINEKRRMALLQGQVVCIGLSWWKRKVMAPFLRTANNQVHFFATLAKCQQAKLAKDSKVFLWGRKQLAAEEWAKKEGLPILRMEDGFIRSVGLGSNLVPPLSLVVDDLGIYFDATQPSRLEHILQNQVFSDDEIQMAKYLSEDLVNNRIGKYNVGEAGFSLPKEACQHSQVILIPGQVEDDASIAYGAKHVNTNLGLIQAVRKSHPEAYLIYKPHPDVISGNRVGLIDEKEALVYVNLVVTEANILDCIEKVDAVHTMTSLAGFEALLRGKDVVCYGAPFYAGWGLTEDKQPTPRRTRKLTLLELVAGAMLLYPIYLNTMTGGIGNPIVAMHILSAQKQHKTQTLQQPYWRRKMNQVIALYRVWRIF